jgi:hypothetical protein
MTFSIASYFEPQDNYDSDEETEFEQPLVEPFMQQVVEEIASRSRHAGMMIVDYRFMRNLMGPDFCVVDVLIHGKLVNYIVDRPIGTTCDVTFCCNNYAPIRDAIACTPASFVESVASCHPLAKVVKLTRIQAYASEVYATHAHNALIKFGQVTLRTGHVHANTQLQIYSLGRNTKSTKSLRQVCKKVVRQIAVLKRLS